MKRCIFIGQAMPKIKTDLHDWPSLNTWLYSIGINDKQIKKYFYYSALVDYFPGAKNGTHRVPSLAEIEKERPRLKETIINFNPRIIVPIGRLSIAHCLNQPIQPLINDVGKIYETDPYLLLGKKKLIIPLPHPSGASTWKHKSKNNKLLLKTLKLLRLSL